jgi:xylulokinase
MDALIGIDIGTTAVKARLSALDGERLDAVAWTYPTVRGPGTLVEQDAEEWWRLVVAALDRLAGAAAGAGVGVRAIGITSQVNTHVFCGPDLVPLIPAIGWADGRAAGQGAALEARISPEARIAALGAPIPIDASHALSRMAWLAEERPDLWARTAHVMAPKDWIIARLTGALGADAIASVGLCGPDLAYAAPVLALVPGAGRVLPPLQDPLQIAGVVAEGPFRGVPVARGTMDAWASLFGTGVARDGQALHLSGTSEVLGIIAPLARPTPGVISFPPWRGITLHAGPTQAGGAALDWVGRLTGLGTPGAAQAAAGARLRADSPLFLPHLAGERAPFWDPLARGTFAGLTGADGPGDLALAVMEGVAFQSRAVMERLEQAAGLRPAVILGGGGGMAADLWCGLRAAAHGRPLQRMQAADAGAAGAVVMAGVAAGLLADLAAAATRLVRADRRFDPAPEDIALADRRYLLWQALYAQMGPVNAGLADLR